MCSKSKDDHPLTLNTYSHIKYISVQIFFFFSTKKLWADKANLHISFYQNLMCNGGHAIDVEIGIGGGAGL